MFLGLFSLPAFAQFQTDSFLEKLLKKHPERFAEVLKDPAKYQIQILYTKIDRHKNNDPHFITHART